MECPEFIGWSNDQREKYTTQFAVERTKQIRQKEVKGIVTKQPLKSRSKNLKFRWACAGIKIKQPDGTKKLIGRGDSSNAKTLLEAMVMHDFYMKMVIAASDDGDDLKLKLNEGKFYKAK